MRTENGMTLLEVMVAMFILAVVSVAGLNLLSSGTENQSHREQILLANLVAHNTLVDVRLADDNAYRAGEYKGKATQAGQPFQWKMVVSNTLSQDFLQAEVFVYNSEEATNVDAQHLLSLIALVPAK